MTEILRRGNKREQAVAPQPLRGLSQPFEPSFVFYNIPGSFVQFRPGQNQSATPWVAQTCRSLACLRHVFVENGANVAYIPMKSVGTYAPPWFFDPASRFCREWSERRIHPDEKRRDVRATRAHGRSGESTFPV